MGSHFYFSAICSFFFMSVTFSFFSFKSFLFFFFLLVLIDFLSLSHSTDGPYIPLCFSKLLVRCAILLYIYMCVRCDYGSSRSVYALSNARSHHTYLFPVKNHIATSTSVKLLPRDMTKCYENQYIVIAL